MIIRIVFCFMLCYLAVARVGFAMTVEVADVSGRAYEESVLKELSAAKDEIRVAMYAMYTRYGESDNPAMKLVEALIAARQRGVYVRVYLDKCPLIGNDLKHLNKANDDAYKMLKDAGIDVSFIRPTLKLHEKLIVIDGETVIDGSTNWTRKALLENAESAEILRGKEFAELKLAQLRELEKNIAVSDNPRQALLEKVRVKNSFLEDTRFAPKMVTNGDEHSFDLYMLLLREFKDKGKTAVTLPKRSVIRIDYAKVARQLGIPVETKNSAYREHIRWVVENLKNKYGLIDYAIDDKANLDVKLLDYNDPSKEYSTPESGNFNLPIAYWEYGLDKQLMLREKFVYMVSIYEQEIARPKLWWQKSLKGLSEKYHIDEWTLDYGLRQIKRLDLIEVWHSRVKAGEDFKDREPNKYRMKELILPDVKERMWSQLEKDFGADQVKAAKEFAAMIDEGNNIQAVKDFIRIIKKYGQENVKTAVDEISKLGADNPLRNIGYITGVLKRMEKENYRHKV